MPDFVPLMEIAEHSGSIQRPCADLSKNTEKNSESRSNGIQFLQVISNDATDERNFVKKAVSWALRNIGKKNTCLKKAAITTAEALRRIDSKAARWIAADAIRELAGVAVQKRLRKQACALLDKLQGQGPRIP